jgi:2-amino-4-hydroxy-6-hydroxymethyldihydropteridine diphosphokinase
MRAVRRVAFALGSNLGDRAAYLQGAVDQLTSATGIFDPVVSHVYETDPVGGPDQGPYLNAVVRVDSSRPPDQLLELAQACEDHAERVRDERWGPRTLDVDLLVVDGITSDAPSLTLPHPRAVQRAFVLAPWRDVDPDYEVAGRPVREWCDQVDDSGVRMTEVVLSSGTR